MRLCTIVSGGKPAVGVKTGNGKIVDLSKLRVFADVDEVLRVLTHPTDGWFRRSDG